MLVVRTIEDPAHPVGKLICPEQSIGLHHLSLSVDPFGLYGVQPRTLLRKKAADDPHSGFATALFDVAVVFPEPPSELFGDVPTGLVPYEEENLLSRRLEFLRTPREKPRRYGTDGPAVHEAQPRPIHLRQVKPVTGYGLRLRVVLRDRSLDEAEGFAILAPSAQGGQGNTAPPALVLESGGPLGVRGGDFHQPVAPPFFLSYRGSGEVIQRFARIQRTPRTRESVARTVSPLRCSSVSPSSKATSAAISKVHTLDSRPNSLGERWSISLKASALFSSNAACTRLGREEPGVSASRPLSSKARMAFLTVWEAHPRFSAIFGGAFPRALASRIWHRRITKASLERSPASSRSRSFFDKSRTKIGGFMEATIGHYTQPSLRMH